MAVTLTSGPAGPGSIDDFELFYARRALHRFRARLGRQGLLDLLAADIEEGNALLRESARASDGTFQGGCPYVFGQGQRPVGSCGQAGRAVGVCMSDS
ncbi:hypothetical protein ACGFZO_00005, partial [[Kitasatospora] papulosa]